MKKTIILSILTFFLLSGVVGASIIIEDADDVWDPSLNGPSFNLNIKPRIQLEYVDSTNSIWHPELNDTPDDLNLNLKPRIRLEYVDSINSIWHPELGDPSFNLDIKPRIQLEYVDSINSIWHTKLIPKDAVTDAKIINWSVNTTIFNPGDCVVANVTIKNTGNLSHEFYIGFSVYDPDGTHIAKKYDAPFTSAYLNKDEVSTEVLTWKVPPDAKEGKWDATVAVWDREESGLLYGEYDRKTKEDAFEILQVIAFRTVIKPSDGEWGVDKDYKVDIYDTSRRAPNPIGDVCKLLGGGYECDVLAFSGTFYFSDTDHDGELSIEEISKAIGEEVDDLLKKKLAEYAWKVHVGLVSSYLALKGSEASIGSAAAAGAPSGVSGFAIPVPTGAISSIFGYMNLEGNPIFSGFINMDQNIFQAACPVNLTVIDQCGRMVSNNGTNQIPNASVIIIGETKTFYLPADLTYSVSVDAYDVGTFNFTSITPVTDGILITGFMNVSITENTTATLEVEPGEAIHTMKIDYDGDGEIDEEKSPDVNGTITAPPRGDLNSDGTLTSADAAIALEIAVGSRPCDPATLATADVSRDNRVTSLDALMILQAAADAITL